jgi:hypothetical protein
VLLAAAVLFSVVDVYDACSSPGRPETWESPFVHPDEETAASGTCAPDKALTSIKERACI